MFVPSWMILVGVGVLLVAAAVGWRCVHRARMRERLATALHDPDPLRRQATVLVATEQGLRANAALLAAHVRRERDPAVLATLVDGVLRSSWEPSDQPAILQLRLWAHEQRRLAEHAPGEGTGPPLVPAPRHTRPAGPLAAEPTTATGTATRTARTATPPGAPRAATRAGARTEPGDPRPGGGRERSTALPTDPPPPASAAPRRPLSSVPDVARPGRLPQPTSPVTGRRHRRMPAVEAGQALAAGPDPLGSDPLGPDPFDADPYDADSFDPDSCDATPLHAEPLHAEPLHAEPLHAEPLHAEPLHAEPLHAEPLHADAPAAVRPGRARAAARLLAPAAPEAVTPPPRAESRRPRLWAWSERSTPVTRARHRPAHLVAVPPEEPPAQRQGARHRAGRG